MEYNNSLFYSLWSGAHLLSIAVLKMEVSEGTCLHGPLRTSRLTLFKKSGKLWSHCQDGNLHHLSCKAYTRLCVSEVRYVQHSNGHSVLNQLRYVFLTDLKTFVPLLSLLLQYILFFSSRMSGMAGLFRLSVWIRVCCFLY